MPSQVPYGQIHVRQGFKSLQDLDKPPVYTTSIIIALAQLSHYNVDGGLSHQETLAAVHLRR